MGGGSDSRWVARVLSGGSDSATGSSSRSAYSTKQTGHPSSAKQAGHTTMTSPSIGISDRGLTLAEMGRGRRRAGLQLER